VGVAFASGVTLSDLRLNVRLRERRRSGALISESAGVTITHFLVSALNTSVKWACRLSEGCGS
jgi:hypothetical protein